MVSRSFPNELEIKKLKKLYYIALVCPVFLYESGTWPREKIRREIVLDTREKNLREWRWRINAELEVSFRTTSIIDVVKKRKRLQNPGQNKLIKTVVRKMTFRKTWAGDLRGRKRRTN